MPGLIAFTQFAFFRSSVAGKRTAALVAPYTLKAGVPTVEAVEAFRMMEAPSGISSAFCTVKSRPDIGVECFVKVFFGDPERDGLSNASISKDDIQATLLIVA